MLEITNSASDIIETKRLILRKFSVSDIDDMLKNWISDNDVQSGYGEPVYTNKNDVVKLLNDWLLQYRWAIILKETNENIGHISFCRLYPEVNTAEVEYCVGKSFWNKGFTTEALKAFIKYTFAKTSVTKLEAFHRSENPASGRVLEKAGMKPVDNVMRFSDLPKAPDGNIYYAIEKAVDNSKGGKMRIAGITYESLVDGPGLRVVVFVQGCELECPECHNPESHSRTGGQQCTVREVIRLIKKPGPGRKMIKGVTFSGGEPFLQAGDCAQIAFEAKRIGWDVTTFTGQTYEELKSRNDADINALLDLTDYLIDGPYIHEQRDLDLKFRGSSNQRIIDMAATRKHGRVKLYYGN